MTTIALPKAPWRVSENELSSPRAAEEVPEGRRGYFAP
jgi:hypothetical protein